MYKRKNPKDIEQGGEQSHKIGYLFRHNGERKRSTAAAYMAKQQVKMKNVNKPT